MNVYVESVKYIDCCVLEPGVEADFNFWDFVRSDSGPKIDVLSICLSDVFVDQWQHIITHT